MSGYIYILREREFIASGELTYKVGRTVDICKRIRGYSKGSRLLFTIEVVDMKETERLVLGIFKEKFVQRLDLGWESFSGDIETMVATVVEAVRMPKDVQKYALTKIDPTIAVIKYVECKMDDLSEKTLKSKDVYESLLEWAISMHYHVNLSHSRFTEELVINFGITHGTHRFTDGVNRALYFPMLHYGHNKLNGLTHKQQLAQSKALETFINLICSLGKDKKVSTAVFLAKFHTFCAENAYLDNKHHAKTLSFAMRILGFDNKLCRMGAFRGHCFIGLDFEK